jgi:hypothetical protein
MAWQLIPASSVRAGGTYKLELLADNIAVASYSGIASIQLQYTQASSDAEKATIIRNDISSTFHHDWDITSLTKTITSTGGVESWEMIGASVSGTVPNDALLSTASVYQQIAAQPVGSPPAAPQVPYQPPQSTPQQVQQASMASAPAQQGMSAMDVLNGVLLAGSVVSLAVFFWDFFHRKD